MPRGMFLLIHDEIMGPEIKCFYFTKPMPLTKEFVSKLYMSHAGFDSSTHIDIKFENYRSISCFTGNLDRRTNKEGILGIIFDKDEEFDNLDLFLQRNLYKIIDKPSNETIQEIFSKELINYLELIKLFKRVEIESIPEILILYGNNEYKSNLLKIGQRGILNSKMADLYAKIINNQKISQYLYIALNLNEENKTYLVLKADKSSITIKKVSATIKFYLENSFYYSLEILALLLLPSIIKIVPSYIEIPKKKSDKSKTFLDILQKSDNYINKFNNTISALLRGDIYITPCL